jgi:Uma2 family endonuclease
MSIASNPSSTLNAFVAPPPIPMKRWTVAEYHDLIQKGILTKDDPYELIEGWLVTKMPKGSRHNGAIRALNRLFRELPDPWFADCQNSLTLTDGEPEPDFVVIRGPESRFDDANPTPADAAIVIETSDSRLQYDRTIKLRTYARAGIPTYWIVNLVDHQVEVYSQPRVEGEEPTYANHQDFLVGQEVPVILDGKIVLKVPVAEACRFKGDS